MSQLRIDLTAPPSEDTGDRTSKTPVRPGRRVGKPIVVFDLDGTLVDTAPDLAASLNHCLRRAGLAELNLDTVRPVAGLGARRMIETGYARGKRPFATGELDEIVECFIAHYRDHIADNSQLYPGTVEALDRLERDGFLLAVCTNKTEELSKLLLRTLGLDQRFVAICGADTFRRRKPDPIHLLGTITAAGGDPAQAVMVGDTNTDIDAAWAAGIPSILVDFGYADSGLVCERASAVIRSFDELDGAMIGRLTSVRQRAG